MSCQFIHTLKICQDQFGQALARLILKSSALHVRTVYLGVRRKRERSDDKGGRYMYGKLMIGGALLAGLLSMAPTVDAASVVVVRPFFGHPYYGYYGPAYGWYWHPGPVVVDVP